jgi:tetratricopeptide (TPR) repeat protein
VFLVDDFQDAPPSLMSLVCSLSRKLPTLPILIAVSADASFAPTRAATELRESAQGQLDINAFTNEEICELLRRILPAGLENENEAAAQLRKLTAGNPLLTDRLIQDLVFGEFIKLEAGAWKLVKPLTGNWLSTALTGICEKWISRLSEPGALVLKRAAVVGDRFSVECLHGIVDPNNDLSSALDEAQRLGLVTRCANDARDDYAFIHGVLQVYLYHLERPEMRREFHSRIAAYLHAHVESIGRAGLLSMAEHYRSASSSGNVDRALMYSVQAAERLIESGNTSDARTHLTEALAIAREHKGNQLELARLLEMLGWIESIDCLETAIGLLEESLHHYEACEQSSEAARLHGKLGILLSVTYTSMDGRRATAHQKRANELLADASDAKEAAVLNVAVALGSGVRFTGDSGLQASLLAMENAESHQDLDTWCMAAATRACALWALGHFREGFALIAIARGRIAAGGFGAGGFSLALADGFMRLLLWDPISAELALDSHWDDKAPTVVSSHRDILESHVGFAKIYAGDIEKAREISKRSSNAFLRAQLEVYEGNWRTAHALLTSDVQRVREIEDIRKQWGLMFWLGRLYRAELNLSKAEQTLREALTIGQAPIPVPHEVCTRTELVLILVQLNRIEEARVELDRCYEIAPGHENWRGIRGLINRANAVWLAWTGDIRGSYREFESAKAVFELYGLPWEQAENDLIWGYLLLTLIGDSGAAEGKFVSALDLYARHNFGQTWVDRVALFKKIGLAASANGGSTTPGREQADSDCREEQRGPQISTMKRESDNIYDLVSTTDLALIATLTHDGIAHIISCVDKIAKLQVPMNRIAEALENGVSLLQTPNTPKRSQPRKGKGREPSR